MPICRVTVNLGLEQGPYPNPCHPRTCACSRASGKRGPPPQHQPLGSPVGDPVVSRNQPEPDAPGLLTVADLGLHEGGRWQAGPDGIAEATLRVQALGRAALGQPSRAQRHALRWRLWQQEGHREEG